MYYQCSENKGADQLRSYCKTDLRLCFRIGKIWFSHDAAHMVMDATSFTLCLFKEFH